MTIVSRRLFVGSMLAATTAPAFADLYDDYINSTSKRPFVSFLARKSPGSVDKPGHSFIAIGTEIDAGLLFYEAIYGYYPADESKLNELKSIFTKVDGILDFKWKDIGWDLEYRVSVYEDKKNAALAVVKTWKSTDPKYNLRANGGKNCSSFAAEVATAVGLKVPSGAGSKLPLTFMTDLKKMNSKP